MALTASTLHRMATGGGNGIHYYKSADTIATVTGSGYFNSVTDRLAEHDIIGVVSETGGTEKVDWIIVTSATGAATVTTSAVEGVTAT
jgi:hypothetical protein